MALHARKKEESSNAKTKSSLNFKTSPPETSSQLESATKHRSHCGADDEQTKGMSTTTEESGDLLSRNIWIHQAGRAYHES